ncbi:MAG: F0F1 ATP synthase subunit gamma [Alistipes sp.]|nr:F0F1 ATP synthase subunit gamma [Alistipes sp.]
MPSLKEVKGRIASVNSTLKITSAMKMVASAKLHRVQGAIENMLPYEHKLNDILSGFLSAEGSVSSPFAEQRAVERVAFVAVSSNSSLCGAFNANVIRRFHEAVASYPKLQGDQRLFFPIGKKIAEAVRKAGFKPEGEYQQLADHPTYKQASALAEHLMTLFATRQIDRVELIYNHFKSVSTQELLRENFLPITLSETSGSKKSATDYIVEPDRETLIRTLIPQVLSLKIYTLLLDSSAAEHAARTIAMQMATDNATDLLQELTIQYNKTRQQLITSELLDIVGSEVAAQ